MVEFPQDLNQQLRRIYQQRQSISWTHPRTLVLIPFLTSYLNWNCLLEFGAWLGAVPIMLKDIELTMGLNHMNQFILIETFEDHEGEIINADGLRQHIERNIQSVDSKIEIYKSVLDMPEHRLDVVHFDSVKWQTELVEQFKDIQQYTHTNTMYVFDDYIAEWPDVIYCVDRIRNEYQLEVISTMGPKIFLGSPELKRQVLEIMEQHPEVSPRIFNIRETIAHGPVVSSGPDLMI